MTDSSEIINPSATISERFAANVTYEPLLITADNFELSSVFDCRPEMKCYVGDVDYHSLMHKVQKPVLTAHKVEALSYFANKLLLQAWVEGLVPIQKTFGFTTKLNDELEIHRLFEIVMSKVQSFEEFIIKPTNGSESIGTLKVFLCCGELKTTFLGRQNGNSLNLNSDHVISDYDSFKYWITDSILGVTSGNIDTHLRHIQPGLIIQSLFPHDKAQQGPTEMKFNTAWGELLYVGCRNAKGVCLGNSGEHLEGDKELACDLQERFFETLKRVSLSLARASTFPNLRLDFFVDLMSGEWVLNEIETLADCRSYPNYILENTGKFYLKGWIDKAYNTFKSDLTVPILRERLSNELIMLTSTVSHT